MGSTVASRIFCKSGEATFSILMHHVFMNRSIPTSRALAIPTLLVAFALGACVTPPPTTVVAPVPVYPTPERIAGGQVINLAQNEPMGVFGTRAILADRPECSTVRMTDGLPVRLGDQIVSPALAPRDGLCPERNARGNTPYVVLNRAVLLSDGLYAANATQECFLPNSGGGNCRPTSR